jgi:signal transduction histidine kinase
VLLLALVALWFGARQVVQPLQALEARATALAWGDYQAVEESVGGIEEIRRLQRALIHLAQKVQNAQQSLRGYIGAITAGQEEERKRLARELHDDTIQSLIALNQRVQLAQLNLVKSHPSEDLSPTRELEEIQNLIELTISDLRRLTQALRPLYLEDLGLVAALEMLARETSQSSNLAIEFHRRGPERRLSPEEELALFRMAQEGLNNVVRHAQAEHASLSLVFSPQELTLTIADDGRGFEVPESPAEFAPSGHFGLLGLHERAELIGAHMEIHSAPGQGTRLVITLPMNKSASA